MPFQSISHLKQRIAEFDAARLLVPHASGPPYELPSDEIELQRTLAMTEHRVALNRTILSPEALRRSDVMFSSSPESDFNRTTDVEGICYDEMMGDVMGSMTGKANPPHCRLRSVSPPYAAEFIRAGLPEGRLHVTSPATLADFQQEVLIHRPQVLLLSGLNVNTRMLVRMALFAREQGVREVWLGGDAAIGPYRILDEAFDRVIWGSGEEYLYNALVGDGPYPGAVHPRAERMLASVEWLVSSGRSISAIRFETLHLALRLGCTQHCQYCAEGLKSFRGKSRPPTPFEAAKHVIDSAHTAGIRRVYFIDPDFGRVWDERIEGDVVRYIAQLGMRWSCLTNVVTLRRRGSFLIEHGLGSVYLGIESLAPSHIDSRNGRRLLSVLDRSWQDQGETIQIVETLMNKGVLVFGLYILFNPGETLDGIWKGVESLRDLVPLSQISTNQPFPGTDEFTRAARERLLFNFDPDSVRYGQMVWAPNGSAGQIYDPDIVTKTYIAAHQAVNDLKRPNGFLDRHRAHSREPNRHPPSEGSYDSTPKALGGLGLMGHK